MSLPATTVEIETQLERLELRAPVRIATRVIRHVDVLVVMLRRGQAEGRGEAAGVFYLNDTPAASQALLQARHGDLRKVASREALRGLLPPGGARNAFDCALWALEAQEQGRSIFELADLPAAPLLTTFTLSADTPSAMARAAMAYASARALKLKLTGDADADGTRVRAVRAARPEVWLGVDANQGYAPATLPALFPALVESGVALLEQPLPRGEEEAMGSLRSPIPTAADESCQDLEELETLPGLFDTVNIKLDKCGGLTEALLMAARARELGLGVMVGNMIGTSLAMAPAMVVGQLCDFVDLDGPLPLTADRTPATVYDSGSILPPTV